MNGYFFYLFIQKCQQYHLKSVYFCIFSHARCFGQKCCTYIKSSGYAERWRKVSRPSELNTSQKSAHCSSHTCTPNTPHTHTTKGAQLKTSLYEWIIMFYIFCSSFFLFFFGEFYVFLNISLSHPYHSVIFLIKYMNFYRKDWLQKVTTKSTDAENIFNNEQYQAK